MDITFLIFSSSLFLRIDNNDETKEYVKHNKNGKFRNYESLLI